MILHTPTTPHGAPSRRPVTLPRLVGLLLLFAASSAAPAADLIPDADCLQCHEDRELSKTNADGRTLSLFVDEARFRTSVHATNGCAACHADIGNGHPDDGRVVKKVDCATCHADQSVSYGASVHGQAAGHGTAGAASCVDCHGAHDVLSAGNPESPLHRSRITETCGACHDDAARDVAASVHGKDVLKGRREAPTCLDCHSEHQIETLKGVSPIRVAEKTCSRCHASERINAKYRMPADRVKTFLGSYHGLAGQFGSTRAANCASCHGYHKVLPSSDPDSTIHPNHLVATCGQCHPGATENFALGRVHVDENGAGGDLGEVLNRWVRRIYIFLIVFTVGLFLVHNGLIWWRKALAARANLDPGQLRMDRGQRVQHFLLAASFILLAISGFALKFPDSWIARLLMVDENIRRWSHRGAAVVMIVLALYHVYYVLFTRPGRQLVRDLWPTRGDVDEALKTARFATGKSQLQGRPSGKFGYAEKIEYWAVVWGTVIMGATGMAIWFPVEVTQLLPRWVIDIATTIHYYEAILACLAIIVWHFYHVIFDPDVYPINWAFWYGQGPKGHGGGAHDAGPKPPDV